MAQAKIFVVFFAFCMILPSTVVVGLPEQGVWNIQMTEKDQYIALTKSMYNQSKISVKILCDANDKEDPPKISIMWVLRWTPCAQEYIGIETQQARISHYLYKPTENQIGYEYKFAVFQQYETKEPITCGSHEPITLKDLSSEPYDRKPVVPLPGTSNNNTKQPQAAGSADHPSTTASKVDVDDGSKEGGDQESDKKDDKEGKPARRKRQADTTAKTSTQPSTKATTQGPTSPKSTTPKSAKMVPGKVDDTVVATTWEDGVWLFALGIDPQGVGSKYNATVTIKMIGPNGYLSAIDWPLLPFYGSMCFVYVFYGIAWMVLIACNWRDILRIQFWIGGVIFLGMLEKAVFFAEYESINATGLSGITMPRYRTGAIMFRGAVVFAELVSCLKRTVARMLVIIVSLGFGIVKPRLGPMLHRVLAVGFLYFVLGSIEGCLRVLRAKGDVSNQLLLASIPLAVLDAAICWWIFTSLVQTTRTLRLRRNLVKLSLYRHFTNTLIFTVLASVVFMIWSIKQHKLTNCLTDWKEIWVDEAFWHLLFSVMLLVIMILWRPTNNNQRYAFSPLLDAADEDDEANEPMMNDAFDGMKLRGGKTKIEYPDSPSRDAKSKAEEDLKWIEENIPASVADTALPSLLDSDEEIMTTKFEMSKME